MAASELAYNPPSDYEENDKDSLIDLSSTNKEFWLLQCPKDQLQDLDFNGQELSLKLNGDGTLGSFVSSSGKSYELVSFASLEPDATVFQSSKNGSKVVGKISRRVSLIHYPEPSELAKSNNPHRSAAFYQRSAATSSIGGSRRSKHTSSSGLSQLTASPSRTSRQTTSLFEFGGSTKRSKKNHDTGPAQGSIGGGQSDVSSLGSAGNSGGKPRKNKHEK